MKRIVTMLLILSVAASAAGCLSISADELYSLPAVSEEYLRLQAQINIVLSRGAVYAAPVRGPNRQAVQLRDLNGDGINEVIAFFSIPGESRLMIYIFTMDEDDYVTADIINSVGTEIESVRYIDMNGDGNMELVLGWQMGSSLKYMSIYSTNNFQSQLILSAEEYTEIASLSTRTGTGEDVVLLRLPTQEAGSAVAVIYSLMSDGELISEEARLSAGIESISHIVSGNLADGVPALFVESEGRFENGTLITDILARQRQLFSNISLNPIRAISSDTVRQRVNSAEVNDDGIIKVPELRRLIAQSETEYHAIDWYAYRSSGSRSLSLTTYHNTFDEWYLILPPDWHDSVSVRREDTVPGERTIVFSHFESVDDALYSDFLKIYRLSGEDAPQRAQQGGRELLLSEASASYAFELLAAPNSFGLTFSEQMVRDNFRLMHAQWVP